MKTIFRTMMLAAAVALAAGCGNSNSKTAEQTVAVEDMTPTVAVTQVSVREVPQEETYTSTIQAYVKNNIAPQTAGRISRILVDIGDFVKKGQVVAEMDQTQLAQVELQLKNNETELNRLRGLYEVGGLSKSDLDAIEMAYNVSKTQYDNLKENATLVSPINGVITARNYDAGDMYAMSAPIYTVEQIVPVKLLVGVSETDYTKVKKGDSVEITADALPGQTFSGKIRKIYPTVDPATRTFTVEVVVDNNNRLICCRPRIYTIFSSGIISVLLCIATDVLNKIGVCIICIIRHKKTHRRTVEPEIHCFLKYSVGCLCLCHRLCCSAVQIYAVL
jgi:multidrug efflux pump subunit AcrA (membrane-fusion protein)